MCQNTVECASQGSGEDSGLETESWEMSEGPENLGSPEWKFSNKEKLGSTFKNLNSPGSSQQPQLPGNGAVCCQARKKNLLLKPKSVPSSKSQEWSLFCAERFWQCRIPTIPVLSARLHVFNICCEWSPKILPPSINIYYFSAFPTPSRKY